MDSLPTSNVSNDQPAGIGRVAALHGGCAWNNLGRNVVFADDRLQPRAIFGDTMYPDDPVTSEYDLDVHVVVDLGDTGLVAVLNHLGLLRIFERPHRDDRRPTEPSLRDDRRLPFVADVERIVAIGDRLITSRPRGDRQPGLLVTSPLGAATDRVDMGLAEESFGVVTGLAAGSMDRDRGWIALGGEGRVRLVEMAGGIVVRVLWDIPVPFLPAVLVAGRDSIWVAGSELGGTALDDYDWERLVGGGLARLDLASGSVLENGRFDGDLAWGSGGVPFVVADGVPCGIDRHGALHVLAPGERVTTQTTPPLDLRPLGIAHGAVVGRQVVFGFNRGGYRLHAVPASRITAPTAGLRGRRV